MHPRLRINEAQLQALAVKAKASPARSGWVKKKPGSDGVGTSRWQKRWLVLYQNILYYFESEASQRPQGVILVELCDCRQLETRSGDAPTDSHLFVVGIQGAAQRQYQFATAMADDCHLWVTAIREASTEHQLQQLVRLKDQCDRLSSQLDARTSEVVRLSKECADQEIELSRIHIQLRAGSLQSPVKRDVARRQTLEYSYPLPVIIKLQNRWRRNRWRRKFRTVVDEFVVSDHAEAGRERNRLIWKLVANEEEYVDQLNMICDLFLKPMRMAAESSYPKVDMKKVTTVFSNIEQISAIHELFLSGLHQQVKKWPAMRIGWLLDVVFPMFSIYHEFIRNSTLSTAMVRDLYKVDAQGRQADIVRVLHNFSPLSTFEYLNELLAKPTQQLSHYLKHIQALLQVTSSYHVDRPHLEQALTTLNEVLTTIEGEASERERITRTLKVEGTIQRGCMELLSPKQTMVRNGLLTHQRTYNSAGGSLMRKEKKQRERHCYLFSHHLVVCRRINNESLELAKEIGVLPLKDSVFEEHISPADLERDTGEFCLLPALAFRLTCNTPSGRLSCMFSCGSPRDKESWAADISQCINDLQIEESTSPARDAHADYGEYMDAVLLSPEHQQSSAFSFTKRAGPESIRSFQLYRNSSQSELKRITYESVSSLCQRLVHPKGISQDYLEIFLATMSAFITHTDFLDFMIQCFREIHDYSHRSPSEVRKDVGEATADGGTPVVGSLKGSIDPKNAIIRERTVLRRERDSEEWGRNTLNPNKPQAPASTIVGKRDSPASMLKSPRSRRPALAEATPPVSRAFGPLRNIMRTMSSDASSSSQQGGSSQGGGGFVAHVPLDSTSPGCSPKMRKSKKKASADRDVVGGGGGGGGGSGAVSQLVTASAPAATVMQSPLSQADDFRWQKSESVVVVGGDGGDGGEAPAQDVPLLPTAVALRKRRLSSRSKKQSRQREERTAAAADAGHDSDSAIVLGAGKKAAEQRRTSAERKESNRLSTFSDLLLSHIPGSPRRSPIAKQRYASASAAPSAKPAVATSSSANDSPCRTKEHRASSDTTMMKWHREARNSSTGGGGGGGGGGGSSANVAPGSDSALHIERSVSLDFNNPTNKLMLGEVRPPSEEPDENVFLAGSPLFDVAAATSPSSRGGNARHHDTLQLIDLDLPTENLSPSPLFAVTYLRRNSKISTSSTASGSDMPIITELQPDQYLAQESSESSTASSRRTSDSVSPSLSRLTEESSTSSSIAFFGADMELESRDGTPTPYVATPMPDVATPRPESGDQRRASAKTPVTAAASPTDDRHAAQGDEASPPMQRQQSQPVPLNPDRKDAESGIDIPVGIDSSGEYPTTSDPHGGKSAGQRDALAPGHQDAADVVIASEYGSLAEPRGLAASASQDRLKGDDNSDDSDDERGDDVQPQSAVHRLLQRQDSHASDSSFFTPPSTPSKGTIGNSNSDNTGSEDGQDRRPSEAVTPALADKSRSGLSGKGDELKPSDAAVAVSGGISDEEREHMPASKMVAFALGASVLSVGDEKAVLGGGGEEMSRADSDDDEAIRHALPSEMEFDENFPREQEEYCSDLIINAKNPEFHSKLAMTSLHGSRMLLDEDRDTDLRSPWKSTKAGEKRLSFRMTESLSKSSAVTDDVLTQPHLHEHILLRIFCILRKWVNHHFPDFATNGELLQKLVKFINELSGSPTTTPEEASSLQVIRDVIARQQSRQLEYNFPAIRERYHDHVDSLVPFTSMDIDAVARQLALIGYALISAIPGRELVGCGFAKDNRRELAPHVTAVSDFYNQVVGLIMWEILQRKNASSRATVIEKWIAIGDACLAMNNFFAITMVTGAMATSAVSRLAKTWMHLSKQRSEMLDVLRGLVAPEKNFAAMRLRLKECTLPALPYMGCYQKDLIYINETKTLNAEGKVDFSKMKVVYYTLKHIQQFQREPYDITPDEKVLKYLLNTAHIPKEDALFEQSLRVEPRLH